MAQFNTTELDFDQIKDNLKEYFKRSGSKFQDWDFDGSGLNNLLDILAYNTHYNAMNNHVAMNETFLDSAQLRSNVVSRAKLLGYVPTSKTAPTASIDLILKRKTGSTDTTYSLNRGTTFTSTLDGTTYTYVLLQDSQTGVSISDTGIATFRFNDLLISEGSLALRSYTINNADLNQKFVIQNKDVDISTLVVKVYDNPNTSTYAVYNKFDNFTSDLDANSQIYFIEENYAGNFEISFGNNAIGKRPNSYSIVELEFLSTKGSESNNSSLFSFGGGSDDIVDGTSTIIVNSKSAGGSEKESVESIRFNAPLSYIAQNRAVTADDYKTLVKQSFGAIDSISVWGGEENDPPQFGKAYISIKPTGGMTLTREEKTTIIANLQSKRMLSIEPVVVDPEYTYLFFNTLFKYNSNMTSSTTSQLESKVRNKIENYNDNRLQNFDGVFRYSQFLREIDSTDTSILNSIVRVYAYKILTLTLGSTITHKLNFDFELFDENPAQSIMQTSGWNYNQEVYYLADEADDLDSNIRNVFIYRLVENTKIKVVNSVGTLNVQNGLLSIDNSKVPLTNAAENITIEVSPNSNDVTSRRNTLLTIDVDKTTVQGEIDTAAVSGFVNDQYTTYASRTNTIISNTGTAATGGSASSSNGASSGGGNTSTPPTSGSSSY